MLLNWLLSAVALIIVAHFVPGISVNGYRWALLTALVIGFVNATIGAVLKVITLPLAVFTLGIFWLVINALMLMLASWLLKPEFVVAGFVPAFWGALVLMLINMLFRWFTGRITDER